MNALVVDKELKVILLRHVMINQYYYKMGNVKNVVHTQRSKINLHVVQINVVLTR